MVNMFIEGSQLPVRKVMPGFHSSCMKASGYHAGKELLEFYFYASY